MPKFPIASRLRIIMWERNCTELDVWYACQPYCKKYGVKLDRKDIEYYVTGKLYPPDDKLLIIAAALNVNKKWLMGFNVPKESPPYRK